MGLVVEEETARGSLMAACADLGGAMRGQRLSGGALDRLEFSGLRMPLSTLALDVFGCPASGAQNGDPDGQLRVTERGAVPMPWLAGQDSASGPASLVPMWMFTDEGRPATADPRHALAGVLARWSKRGWVPRVAATLEVYLVDDRGADLAPATPPGRARAGTSATAGVAPLEAWRGYLDAVQAGAEEMGLPLEGIEVGAGPGQLRLHLTPAPAMRAADDAWLLKALLAGTARAQGLAAGSLAMPFADAPGSALHLAFWAEDRDKRNLFDNGLHSGSELMRQAVAGAVSCLPGAMLIFAPHEPSYARYDRASQAPTGAAWGYENRSCALRIPGGDPARRRIEHRAPGADANPYLALAAVLGGALAGIEDGLSPPAPVIGSAWDQRVLQCPMDWDSAIDRFAASPRMARIFPADLIETLVALKRQEQQRLARLPGDAARRALWQGAL